MTRFASVLLVLSLGFSGALPTLVLAQDVDGHWRSVEAEGPLTRAIRREGVRLALTPQGPQGGSAEVEWSRVRKLEPGMEITLTNRGSQTARRVFVSADESGITVLNLSDPMLPASAARALRKIATQHPDYLEGAATGGTFLLDKVRLTSAGMFVADRKVADLQDVVETSARQEVAQIKTQRKGRGFWGHLGPLGGYFVGSMSGGFGVGLACQAAVGRDRCDTGAFLTGALVGGIAGGVYGFRAAHRDSEDVVYGAP